MKGHLEEAYRRALILTFGGGTNEIQRDIIATVGLGMPTSATLIAMDFSFTEAEHDVIELAARILRDRVTPESLAELERSGEPRFDRALYAELARADLLGIGLPEAVGGNGLGLLAQALVLEQIGRTLAPVPYLSSIVVAADTIAAFGTPSQIETWVRPAIDGDVILAAALTEPLNRTPRRPTTVATPEGNGWRLDGVKSPVSAATIADALVVTATLGARPSAFIVPIATSGVTISPQATTTHEPYGYVEFDRAVVGPEALIGGAGADGTAIADRLLERATIGLCALQLGVTDQALRDTAAYTAERVQFGRPIATFQAVGHRCADAYIDVEAIRLTLWQAIDSIERGRDAYARRPDREVLGIGRRSSSRSRHRSPPRRHGHRHRVSDPPVLRAREADRVLPRQRDRAGDPPRRTTRRPRRLTKPLDQGGAVRARTAGAIQRRR